MNIKLILQSKLSNLITIRRHLQPSNQGPLRALQLVLLCTFCATLLGCSSGNGGGNSGSQGPNSIVVDNLGIGDVAGNESFLFANNSALLTGPAFGSNQYANVELRKGVAFEVVGETSSIVAERVVIVREASNHELPFVVAYIRNNSDSLRCGIHFDDIEIVHEDGEVFQVIGHFFTSGGVNNSDNISTGTVHNCLPAGGTGYHVIAGSQQGLYDNVAQVRFSLADNVNITEEFQALPGTVLPVSYEVATATDGLITLTILVQNNLSQTIRIAPPLTFALDEKGQPVSYSPSGLESTAEAFTISAGETKPITNIMYLSGQSSSIRSSIFFVYPQ